MTSTGSQTPSSELETKDVIESTTTPGNEIPQNQSELRGTQSGSDSQQASQILQISNLELQLSKSRRELESIVIRYAKSEQVNLQHKNKIDELDKKLKRAIKDNESLANRVRILTTDKNHLSETLSAKVAQLTVLEQKSCNINTDHSLRLKELEDKVAELEESNSSLLQQIETYKCKEGELLDFSERLSMRQMLLQTELDKALNNVPDYKAEYEELLKSNNDLSEQVDELTQQLAVSNDNLKAEQGRTDRLMREKGDLEAKWQRNAEELENDKKVMQRRHQNAMKEILKQMKHLQAASSVNSSSKHSSIILTQ